MDDSLWLETHLVKQMETQKEELPVSSSNQSTLATVERTQVYDRHPGAHMINLWLVPLIALLVWFLFGGWLYFFGLPPVP
jgi:hypothetical protein